MSDGSLWADVAVAVNDAVGPVSAARVTDIENVPAPDASVTIAASPKKASPSLASVPALPKISIT